MPILRLTFILGVLLVSGCLQATDNPPPGNQGAAQPECPVAAEPREGTINTEIGEHNITAAGGYTASGSYADFSWAWPRGLSIALNIRAEWDSGPVGEKEMQLRVEDRDGDAPLLVTHGPSPILLNFTLTVPGDRAVRIFMEPYVASDPAAVVSKSSFDTHVTVQQTLLCA